VGSLQALIDEGREGDFDLIFIDADKPSYPAYYEATLPLLAPRGVMAVDNVLRGGRVVDAHDAGDRQVAAFNDLVQRDPENRLLWRMNRVRLTAEQVRDSVLQFGGRLDLAMAGPSAVQFVHRGKATFMPDGGAPAFLDYDSFDPDTLENRRRSIYRFVFRTVPDPFMDALDCPDGASMTPVRSVSTTPLQAFAMLNSVFLIRQCEHIAHRLSDDGAAPDARTENAFRLLLLRSPSSQERQRFTEYVRRHGLANTVQILLNSNEFLYVD
jgi:hypothetical protein